MLQLLMVHQEDACALPGRVNGLPLALTTASAYLYQIAISLADYLGLYNASWTRLQQKTLELLSQRGRACRGRRKLSCQSAEIHHVNV